MREGPVDALNGEREACIERVLALVHLPLFLVKYRQCTRPLPPTTVPTPCWGRHACAPLHALPGRARGAPRQPLASAGCRKQAAGSRHPDGGWGRRGGAAGGELMQTRGALLQRREALGKRRLTI
jgi:hypothetical protein